MISRKDVIIILVVFCLTAVLFASTPIRSSPGAPPYDPWLDVNDDGIVNMRDIGAVCNGFMGAGTPLNKTFSLYDSGWINITDKAGKYFTITHGLNRTDIMVDIIGKTTMEAGSDHRYLGLTGYTPEWHGQYGETGWDEARSVIQTSDGGYAIAGWTNYYADFDFKLVKTDASGVMQWKRAYGFPGDQYAWDVMQIADGGYLIAGYTYGWGSDSSGLVLITDSLGHYVWHIWWDGLGVDEGWDIIPTADGGFAIAGRAGSNSAGMDDFVLWKFNENYIMQWGATCGGVNGEGAYSVVQTPDGGYALAGYTWSFGAGDRDFWLVKIDGNGVMQWNKTYGGPNWDWTWDMIQTSDGGYALAGYTWSFGAVNEDCWIVKTDASGNMQWNRRFGGLGNDEAWGIVQTSDGGFAVGGLTDSFGAGAFDFLIFRTDAFGNILWSRTYGGDHYDEAYCMIQNSEGSYALAGRTETSVGNKDICLVKTEETESGIIWARSTANSITLYRSATDVNWNFVRIYIWKVKESP